MFLVPWHGRGDGSSQAPPFKCQVPSYPLQLEITGFFCLGGGKDYIASDYKNRVRIWDCVKCHLGSWVTSCTLFQLPCAWWGSFPVLLGLWVSHSSPGEGVWDHSSSLCLSWEQ